MEIEFVPMLPERDRHWLSIALPVVFTEQTRGIVALDKTTNRPVAACLFDTWSQTACCGHWWIDRPLVLKHGFFEEVTKYVYETCGKSILIGMIADDATKSSKLAKKVGFTEVGRIKDGVDWGVDQVLYEMRVEDAGRWYTKPTEEAA